MGDSRSRFADGVGLTLVIAGREFNARTRTRVFAITTALAIIGIAGYIVLQASVFGKTTSLNVGFVGAAQQLSAPMKAAMDRIDITVTTHAVATLADGKAQVRSGALDALVSGPPTATTLTVQTSADGSLQTVLTDLAREEVLNDLLGRQGISAAAIDRALAATSVEVTPLTPQLSAESIQELVIGILVSGTLYVSLVVYGQFVAAGVIEEKSNRIVELLLTTVRPWQLMVGKIMGIGMVAFLQIAAVAVVALAAAGATKLVSIPTLGVDVLVGGLLWLILGFLMYALVFAAAGSMVSRQEDVSGVTMPVILLLVAAWIVTLTVVAPSPRSTATMVLSLIPPTAPMVMPLRIAVGDVPLWQVALSVLLTVATIYLLAAIAGRIYRNSVLRVGGRVRLGEALGLAGAGTPYVAPRPEDPAEREHLM